MIRIRDLGLISILFFSACQRGTSVANSRMSTIYGTVEGTFATHSMIGLGVLWLVRDGKLLYPFCSAVAVSSHSLITARHCMRSVGPSTRIWYDTSYLAAPDDLESQLDLASPYLEFTGTLQEPPDLSRMVEVFPRAAADAKDRVFLDVTHGQLEHIAVDSSPKRSSRALLYSYPSGKPLMITGPCQLHYGNARIFHDCDSLPGSSGGLLVDAESLTAIGMHIQGGGSNNATFFNENHRFETREELLTAYCGSRPPDTQTACVAEKDAVFYNSALDFLDIIGPAP